MQFPGTEQAYRGALVNVTAAPLLGEAAVWAAEEQHDGAFNLTNGDVFRWSHVWPQLADWFGLDVGEPQPISLAQRLTALKPLWQTLAQGEGLAEANPERIAPGPSATSSSMSRRTPIFDVTKARQAGFGQMVLRSDEVLLAHLEDMRRRRLIP